jgi:hypothetical protein
MTLGDSAGTVRLCIAAALEAMDEDVLLLLTATSARGATLAVAGGAIGLNPLGGGGTKGKAGAKPGGDGFCAGKGTGTEETREKENKYLTKVLLMFRHFCLWLGLPFCLVSSHFTAKMTIHRSSYPMR